MTHSKYNHMSISADSELTEVYSFARRYRVTPFYGGFVRETPDRFKVNDKPTHVKICAIPISAADKEHILDKLRTMKGDDRYIYNFFSAACVPLHHKIRVRDAYTCVEFAVKTLYDAGFNINESKYYGINELERMFDEYVVYEGEYPYGKDGEADLYSRISEQSNFDKKIPRRVRYGSTIRSLYILTVRKLRA